MVNKNFDIDWDFIASLEGKLIRYGYVPKKGHSGVTIASGFDIGQHSIQDLVDMNLPMDLVNKLHYYTEVKDDQAEKALASHPLMLSNDEVEELDKAYKEAYARHTENEYDNNSDIAFCILDRPKQTVICSVAFQYGSLKNSCPRFFATITKGLWKAAVAELKDFGDNFSSRRLKEAALLEASLNTKKGI